jgi:hypothetical protein
MSYLRLLLLIAIISLCLSKTEQESGDGFDVLCQKLEDCKDLTPPATFCGWAPESTHGFCGYQNAEGKMGTKFTGKPATPQPGFEVPCRNVKADCAGLTPTATACAWAPGATNGKCGYGIDGKFYTKFTSFEQLCGGFKEGDCEGLTPKASACAWGPEAKHGRCAHREGDKMSVKFTEGKPQPYQVHCKKVTDCDGLIPKATFCAWGPGATTGTCGYSIDDKLLTWFTHIRKQQVSDGEGFEVPCYGSFANGECDGLIPKAGGCVNNKKMPHGKCYNIQDGKISLKFTGVEKKEDL